MRTSSNTASQNRSALMAHLNVALFFIVVFLFSVSAGWAQQVTVIPNPPYFPFTYVGNSSTSTVTLSNSANVPLSINSISIRGEQSQAGFLNTIAGNPSGIDPAMSPQLLPAPATSVLLKYPSALMSGGNETFFIGDRDNNLVLLYDSMTQTVKLYAGTGVACSNPTSACGDGGPATLAQLNGPQAFGRDGWAALYIADTGDFRIRKVTSPYSLPNPPTISTIAGNGLRCTDSTDPCGDEGLAVNARLGTILGIGRFTTTGDTYISDYDNCRIRRVDVNGYIHAVAGNGVCGFGGDGDLASKASLNHPSGIIFDELGTLYIADTGNNRVRAVDPITGIISTFAGNGNTTYDGDWVPANSVGIPAPRALTVDFLRNVFIIGGDSVVRKVNVDTGLISTIAGTGVAGYNGDTLAALTQLNMPQAAITDGAGNLIIADGANGATRRVDFFTQNTDQEFTQTNDCPSVLPVTLPPASCTVTLNFAPALHNARRATLEITQPGTGPNDLVLDVPLAGLGVHTYVLVSVPSQSQLVMPRAAVGVQGTTGTIRFGASGSFAIHYNGLNLTDPSGSFAFNDSNCRNIGPSNDPTQITSYSYCYVTITFTPKSAGTFNAQFQFLSDAMNAPLTVNVTGTGVMQQSPNITWNPAPVVYGTALGPKQLNAVATDPTTNQVVPGTFNYIPGASTVLTPGPTTLNAYFTPADPVAYGQEGASANITVGVAPLTVTVKNISMLTTDPAPTFSSTFAGLVGSDQLSVNYVVSTLTTPPVAVTYPYVAGFYSIVATANAGPWSNYNATFVAGTLTVGTTVGIDLVETFSSASLVVSGTVVQLAITDTVTNTGQTVAGASTTNYYLSPTSLTPPPAIHKWMLIGNRNVNSVTPGPGNSATITVTLPATLTGSYYVLACANAYQTVTETNYANDCTYFGAPAGTPISILPDLTIPAGSLSFTPASPMPVGSKIQVFDTTQNIGTAPAAVTTSTAYYVSTLNSQGQIANLKWMYLGNRNVPMLAPNASSTTTVTTAPSFTLPSYLKGSYAITACANAYNTVQESNTANNCQSVPITLK